jgi:hypothetical protein
VETLESRYCLNASLSFSLTANVLPLHMVELSGTVTDPNPASVAINFTGAYTGTTTANSSGKFDLISANATLGALTAVATDGQGNTTTDQSVIFVAVPTISLTLTYGAQKTVTVSGTVNDIDPGGRTITLSGMMSGTVVTDTNGAFTWTGKASNRGVINASTVDLWGQQSNTAQVTVAPSAPVISNFAAGEQPGLGNYWTFSGTVNDCCSVNGLTVTLGGMPSLKGKTVQVLSDGTFEITVQLQNCESGTASAVTQDWWGQASNLAMTDVHPT